MAVCLSLYFISPLTNIIMSASGSNNRRRSIIPGPVGILSNEPNISLSIDTTRSSHSTATSQLSAFMSTSWRAASRALEFEEIDELDLIFLSQPDPDVLKSSIADRMKKSGISSIISVIQGDRDLQVPRLLVIVQQAVFTAYGMWTLRLLDPTGSMSAYLSVRATKSHDAITSPGSCLLLQRVSVFVNKVPFERFLNIHEDCIVSVFPLTLPLDHQDSRSDSAQDHDGNGNDDQGLPTR